MKSTCKSCIHWKPEQSELEYSRNAGICTCHKWSFCPTSDAGCMVLDRNNPSSKYMRVHRFESQKIEIPIGKPERSQYCFVTDENFGCIHQESKNPGNQ